MNKLELGEQIQSLQHRLAETENERDDMRQEINKLKEEIEKLDRMLQVAGLALAFKEAKET